MTSPAAYEPWSRIEDVDVPVEGVRASDGTLVTHIRLPYVYARDAVAVAQTGLIVVGVILNTYRFN